MFEKLTTFVPLTLKTPVVLNVTGSACAAAAANIITAATSTGVNSFRTWKFIWFPLFWGPCFRAPTQHSPSSPLRRVVHERCLGAPTQRSWFLLTSYSDDVECPLQLL